MLYLEPYPDLNAILTPCSFFALDKAEGDLYNVIAQGKNWPPVAVNSSLGRSTKPGVSYDDEEPRVLPESARSPVPGATFAG